MIASGAGVRVVQPHVRMGDPHVCSDDRHRLALLHALYRPLVRRAAAGAFRAGVARAWHTNDVATHWTFELDPEARWSDGTAVTAGDAAASLERLRDDPPEGELGTSGVYQGYLRGTRIEATGAHTLELRTPEPMADLLDVLVELFVLPERHLAAAAELPPGSGPYRLVEHDEREVVLEARAADGRPPLLRVSALQSAEARWAEVASGRASIASDVDPRGEERGAGVTTWWQASSVATTFMFNLTHGPCADARVRRALNLAVDVDALIDTLFAGRADATSSPCTPTQLGHDPTLPPYPHDPERARALLRAAGHETLTLTFDVPSRLPDEAPRLALLLAESFERVGVTLEVLTHEDRPAYAEMVRDGRIHDAACFDSSPHSSFRLLREKFHSRARGPWWLGYTSVRFDALVDVAQRTSDLAERRATYQRAAALLHDDAPWLYLYGARLGWALAPEVAAWRPTPDGLIAFEAQTRSTS